MTHQSLNFIHRTLVGLTLLGLGVALAQTETHLTLELEGGAHAGSFEDSLDNSACLYGSSSGDDWRTLYAIQTDDPSAFSTFLLLIPETTPAASGSANFFVSAGFGTYEGDSYSEYIVDPANGNGSGTVTVAREGNRARIGVVGQTADGVRLALTLECANVLSPYPASSAAGDLGTLDFGPGDLGEASATGTLELRIGSQTLTFQTSDEVASCERLVDERDLLYSYYPEGYASLEIYTPDLEAALLGTDEFGLGFNLDPVYRPEGGGRGTLQVVRDGDQLTLTAVVTTAEDTVIEATATCPFAAR